MVGLSIRIDFGSGNRVGPGKIQLLEQIAALGSISAGGRALDMSYRQARELIDELNTVFGRPLSCLKWRKKRRWSFAHAIQTQLDFPISRNSAVDLFANKFSQIAGIAG